MGIGTHFYKKYHIYEPGALKGFWSIHVDGIFCEKRRKRKRKERGKKGGRKKRKGREEVHCWKELYHYAIKWLMNNSSNNFASWIIWLVLKLLHSTYASLATELVCFTSVFTILQLQDHYQLKHLLSLTPTSIRGGLLHLLTSNVYRAFWAKWQILLASEKAQTRQHSVRKCT